MTDVKGECLRGGQAFFFRQELGVFEKKQRRVERAGVTMATFPEGDDAKSTAFDQCSLH
jgi:hypothetical protein